MNRYALATLLLTGLVVLGYGAAGVMRRAPVPVPAAPAAAPQSPAARPAQINETPEQTVRRLLSLPHALEKLSPEDRERLRLVKESPQPYLDAVRQIYSEKGLAGVGEDEDEAQRFERALLLLGEIGTPEAAALLAHYYAAFDDAVSEAAVTAESARRRDGALQLRRSVLLALNATKQEDVINRILGRLDRLDYATRVAAQAYLLRSSAGDPKVLKELRRHLNDRRSPLLDDKSLKRTVELLEGRQP